MLKKEKSNLETHHRILPEGKRKAENTGDEASHTPNKVPTDLNKKIELQPRGLKFKSK